MQQHIFLTRLADGHTQPQEITPPIQICSHTPCSLPREGGVVSRCVERLREATPGTSEAAIELYEATLHAQIHAGGWTLSFKAYTRITRVTCAFNSFLRFPK